MKQLALLLLIGSLFALTTGGALANGAPLVIPFESQFDAFNPCTGEVTTLSLSRELRTHQFHNEAGDVHHYNIILVADLQSTLACRDSPSGTGAPGWSVLSVQPSTETTASSSHSPDQLPSTNSCAPDPTPTIARSAGSGRSPDPVELLGPLRSRNASRAPA